jgi:uncharacterized protein (TIGR02246 family)
MKRTLISISLLLLLLSGCNVEQDHTTTEEDLAAIRQFLEHSGEAVNAGDVEAEVNRFTEDGIYMWPGLPSIEGHEELRKFFERRFAEVEVQLENVTVEVEVSGDWAFDRGKYVANIRSRSSGKVQIHHGKYINILRRQADGTWRVARRIRNLDHPLP